MTNINKVDFYKKSIFGRNIVHFRNLFLVKNFIKNKKFHYVYLNTLDDFIIAIYISTLFIDIKLCGLYVQPRLSIKVNNIFQRLLYTLKKHIVVSTIKNVNQASKILTIDQLAFTCISKELSKDNQKKLFYIKDFFSC